MFNNLVKIFSTSEKTSEKESQIENNQTNMSQVYDLNTYIDFDKISDEYLKEKNITTVKYKDYMIMKYDKTMINIDNVDSYGLFRSVIFKNNKLVGFSPPKCNFIDNYEDKETNVFEEYVEGSMINVFYDNDEDEWIVCTRSNIGGVNTFFRGSKTFRYMFLDATNSYEEFSFDKMNKEYMYSFVMQHKDNRVVLQINKPKLYLTNVYKCNKDYTVEEISLDDEGVMKNIVDTPEVYSVNNIDEAKSKYASDSTIHFIQGVIIRDGLKRYRIRNQNNVEVKKLRGNQSKMQYQYFVLRKENTLNKFLTHYPEYTTKFNEYTSELYEFTNQLYSLYIECFIHRKHGGKLAGYPGKYKQHMYNLHKQYIDGIKSDPDDRLKHRITKRKVIEYIKNLEPAELMFSINFDKGQRGGGASTSSMSTRTSSEENDHHSGGASTSSVSTRSTTSFAE